jgi:hypothetical protein
MINGAMVLEQEATLAQIQRIVQSKAFRTSEVHRNLLTYLAEKSLAGASDSLKEYTVGLDVFAKPESYDPRQESTVRMHVARLRQKLAEYYRTEGVDDPIIVDLPKGGFKVTFEPRLVVETPSPPVVELPAPRPRLPRWVFLLVAALVVAAGAALYFGTRLREVERTASTTTLELTPELQQIWAPFLSSSRPLLVCLSTPAPGVTGVGAANGAFLLGQFLGLRKPDMVLTSSDQISAPEIAMGNVVFLGPTAGNRNIQAVSLNREISLEANGLRNLNPKPGEQSFYPDRPGKDSLDIGETHVLISHVPGLYGTGESLYISGNGVAAVMGGVQVLTDPVRARALVAKLRGNSAKVPRYFQVAMKIRAMDDMPIDIGYVLHRELAQTQ